MSKRLWLRSLSAIAISSTLVLVSSASFATTLQQVVNRTVQTNPNVLASEKIQRAAVEGVEQARAGYFPTLDFSASYGREKTDNITLPGLENTLWRRQLSLQARQMIFDGLLTPHEVARNKSRANADSFQALGSAEDAGLQATQAYIDVLRNRKIVRIARQNLSAHQRTYDMVRKRSESGISRKADISQAEGRLALAKANLVAAQSNLRDSLTAFHRVTGMDARTLTRVKSPGNNVLPKNEHQAVHAALENHPILKAAMSDVEEANAQHQVAKAANYPRLDAVLAANDDRDIDGIPGHNKDYVAMLQLQYNIFNGGADFARQRETAYLTQQAVEVRNNARRQVIENMKLAWNALVSSRQRLGQLRQHEISSGQVVKAYRQQFQLGKRTLLDLLDSENESFTAQTEYVNGQNEVLLSKYRVLNAMGKLLSYLRVQPPAEAFPAYYHQMAQQPVHSTGPETVFSKSQYNVHSLTFTPSKKVVMPNTKNVAIRPEGYVKSLNNRRVNHPADHKVVKQHKLPYSSKMQRSNQNQYKRHGVYTVAPTSKVHHVLKDESTRNVSIKQAHRKGAIQASNKVTKKTHVASKDSKKAFAIELGIFSTKNNADRIVQRLKKEGFAAVVQQKIIEKATVYMVYVGPESSKKTAALVEKKLQKQFNVKTKMIEITV